MSVQKTPTFIADVERQYEWYVRIADDVVADRYLDSVEATCRLLARHTHLGPKAGFANPRLRDWRFFRVSRPFHQHILFYEAAPGQVVLHRAMHGHRDLPRRL